MIGRIGNEYFRGGLSKHCFKHRSWHVCSSAGNDMVKSSGRAPGQRDEMYLAYRQRVLDAPIFGPTLGST